MTLQEFVTESLKSIINAVSDIQEFAKEKNAIVNPTRNHDGARKSENMWMWRGNGEDGIRPVTKIDFDVAVVVGTEENSKLGGGLSIQIFKASAETKSSDANQITSRISFAIDGALPETVVPDKKIK